MNEEEEEEKKRDLGNDLRGCNVEEGANCDRVEDWDNERRALELVDDQTWDEESGRGDEE